MLSGASSLRAVSRVPLSAFRCLFVESREPRSGAFTEGECRFSGASTQGESRFSGASTQGESREPLLCFPVPLR